jgi:hypothetical protein
MLGVRRAGVTTALHGLEDQALIRTARGSVTLLTDEDLKNTPTVSTGVPEAEFDRLFKTA